MRIRRYDTALALAVALVAAFATATRAEQWKVVDDDWCSGKCEVREITLQPRDELRIRSVNGSIEVESWDRDEIRIRARVKLSHVSSKEAQELFDQIEIDTDDVVRARGPKRHGSFLGIFGWSSKGWSVSYRVTLPRRTALDVATVNGGIEVTDVGGAIDFNTTNGSVKIFDASGDVTGGTTNGGVHLSLSSRDWDGHTVDLHTTNGGIKVDLPRDFSARLDLATTNGGIKVEYPVTIETQRRNRLKGTIGDGEGVVVRARTTNGGVSLRRGDA